MLFCWLCYRMRLCVLARVIRLWLVGHSMVLLQLCCHHLARGRHYLRLRTLPNLKIAILFISLIPCLIPPRELREKTEGTPTQLPAYKKCFLLRLPPKKVNPIPKKVDSFPETVDLSVYQQNHPIILKLFFLKICTSANFVVPLQPNPMLEGNMSCEKRFAIGLS